ncbi:MAG: aminoacyltransferase [Humibacillus sp.]|nr:aminoacyltransferase [Humibacillus sp.]MDN5775804.1 aminoacyltransferase [Humibacillus sp.]
MNAETDAPTLAGPFTVRPVTADEARETVLEVGGSFLQTPEWARTKPDWQPRHLGWFDPTGRRVGAALVLTRSIPRTKRGFAYLPEGPALPWEAVADDPGAWLEPLVAWARSSGAFALRLGFPVPARTWAPEPVKKQVAAGGLLSFTSLPATVVGPEAAPLESWLAARSWLPIGAGSGAAVGQPRYLCVLDIAGRDAPTVLRSMNQQWRRNIKKAEKAGVQVRSVGAEGVDTFHALYCESAQRDHFHPRPKAYFAQMLAAFGETDPGRLTGRVYEAHVDGDVLASAIMLRVGDTFSYLYGGSTERNRDARASNALQWRAIQDAIEAGCAAYDFRGFNTSLGATSPLTGLLLFKLGAGADVVELVGERELVLNRFWHTVFDRAMALRVAINSRRLGSSPDSDV